MIVAVLALMPLSALGQDTPHPKYPPGFDCANLSVGDEREDCRRSQLDPKADDDQDKGRAIFGAESPGSVSPPTVPDQPDNVNPDDDGAEAPAT